MAKGEGGPIYRFLKRLVGFLKRLMGKSEGGPIYRFLKRLSEDPDHLEAYRADPEGTMDKAGLSEEHKDVIRSGDRERIEKALRREGLTDEAKMFISG